MMNDNDYMDKVRELEVRIKHLEWNLTQSRYRVPEFIKYLCTHCHTTYSEETFQCSGSLFNCPNCGKMRGDPRDPRLKGT